MLLAPGKLLNSWEKEAFFSGCGKYRWSLRLSNDPQKKHLLFIGLNPSDASEERNDHTLLRLIGYCNEWDYGTLVVLNLFARISKYPALVKRIKDPVGGLNDLEIDHWLHEWSSSDDWDLWLGWGADGTLLNRNNNVLLMLKRYSLVRRKFFPKSSGPLTLGFTKEGHPRHPLYLPRSLKLDPYPVE